MIRRIKFQVNVKNKLACLVNEYFSVRENPSDLIQLPPEQGACLELVVRGTGEALRVRGYVFVTPLQLYRDGEERMQKIRLQYMSEGKEILKSFTDFVNKISGFSWVGPENA